MTTQFTPDKLLEYNGTDGRPIYISVRGVVYDVTPGVDFYGPGAGYSVFAGKDVSRSLGKMSISDTEANAGWDNLSEEHMKVLIEWETKYKSKYQVVGTLVMDEAFVKKGKDFPE
eukprot:PhF_6_TR6762/c0_g1_i1/m.9756/K17278/PGRMC1_2; membrane-associated progesterone receptor component